LGQLSSDINLQPDRVNARLREDDFFFFEILGRRLIRSRNALHNFRTASTKQGEAGAGFGRTKQIFWLGFFSYQHHRLQLNSKVTKTIHKQRYRAHRAADAPPTFCLPTLP
jgi:hypothetical protein